MQTPPAPRLTPPAVVALLLASGVAFAALPAPPEADYPTPEAQINAMNRQAEQSLREKIATGIQRHELRLEFRSALLQSRQTRAEEREQQILAQLKPAPSTPAQKTPGSGRAFAWFGLLVCIAIIGWFGLRVHADPTAT